MGIYIDGMEMPQEGSWTTVRIYPDGTCAVPNWQGDCTLIKDTKAVPVPPHGRLGDLDKLADNMRSATAGMEHRAIIMHEIRRAPTIIPAESEEEGET